MGKGLLKRTSYHNLWLLDERFSTFQFIGSDKSISSFSGIKSSLEPDIVMFNNEQDYVDSRMSFGSRDVGEIESLVVFEFKRPGETAHQKHKSNKAWNFSELVDKYFDDFMYRGKNKNYRGNPVIVTATTPKFGYIILDVIAPELENYNKEHGWKKTPFDTFYRIEPERNLHLETMTYQTLLRNAEKRMNPFFDHLFPSKL